MESVREEQVEEQPGRKVRRPSRGCLIAAALLLLLAILLCLNSLSGAGRGDGGEATTEAQPENTSEGIQSTIEPSLESSTDEGPANEYDAFIQGGSGSGEKLEQASGQAFQTAQECADTIGYPGQVEDTWDIWDLAFYSIQVQETLSASPEGCSNFVQEAEGDGLGEFLSALGGEWWQDNAPPLANVCNSTMECAELCAAEINFSGKIEDPNGTFELNAYISQTIPDPGDRPGVCNQFQREKLGEDLGNLLEEMHGLELSCRAQTLPSSLCPEEREDETVALCAAAVNWAGETETEEGRDELYRAMAEEYALTYGDIPSPCLEFLYGVIQLEDAIEQHRQTTGEAADCLWNSTCDLDYQLSGANQAENCAQATGWTGDAATEEGKRELADYLLISAPWLPANSLPNSCLNWLAAIAPEAYGKSYWQAIAAILAEHKSATP